MCGIAGIHSLNPKYDQIKSVQGMLDRMTYRGPDQSGVGKFSSSILGMTRLSIIDLESHKIPYEDDNNRAAIVFNGEIYNHDSIRSNLKSKYTFKTSSDAETILYNYLENGIQSFNELNGMYAFSLYDKAKDTTYVVRDKTGEKPIYYTLGSDFISFSSEIKCLFELVKPQFNQEAISYKAYEFCVGRETLFKNIYQLEPGEFLKIKDGKSTIHTYWKVWDNLIDIKDDIKQIKNDLTELLEDSILLRTNNCAHKYGCLISGGVDSAIVACIAKPDFIYTCHYNLGPEFDELTYAHSVAKHIKKELIIVEPGPKDFRRLQEKIIYHLDTPCTWTSFSLWMLLERAQSDIKVIMTGDGADEIFAGYHRYHLLHHDEQIHKLEAMQQYSFLINKYYGSPEERYAKLINRSENQYDKAITEFLKESIQYYFSQLKNDIVHGMGLNDFYSSMQVLLQMSDRMSMAFSIENRSPFLDYRLVQYAYSMPSKYKIKNGITKWVLKEIARKLIPKKIVDRIDKRGFSAPINHWFGWGKTGKYDRSIYRKMVLNDWQKVFGITA